MSNDHGRTGGGIADEQGLAGRSRFGHGARRVVSRVPDGVLLGMAAYLGGYAIVYAATLSQLDTFRLDTTASDLWLTTGSTALPSGWKLAGWVFYGSHSMSVEVPTSGGVVSRNLVTLFVNGPSQIPYFLLAPMLLLACGYGAVSMQSPSRPREAGLVGASLVLGYHPLAVLGAYLTYAPATVGGTTVSVGPNVWMAAIYAGVVYPVWFGATGGIIGYLRHQQYQSNRPDAGRRETTPESPDRDSAEAASRPCSDVQTLLTLLDAAGGQLKQKELVQRTTWSETKVSRLTSRLEEEGRVEKLRIGRENLVSRVDDATDTPEPSRNGDARDRARS